MKFKEYIMLVSETDKPGVYAYEEVQPLVRCKDCAHAIELVDGSLECHGYLVETWDYYNDAPKQNIVLHDGFCAWGERMEQVDKMIKEQS